MTKRLMLEAVAFALLAIAAYWLMGRVNRGIQAVERELMEAGK